MQTVRISMEINAPVERCYRLALSTELARDAMDGWRTESEAEEIRTLAVNEPLRWGAQRKIRIMGEFTETISTLRTRTLLRRTYTGPKFAWGEGEQHFAPMNDGAWVKEQIRFQAKGGLWTKLRERRMRRAIIRMMTARAQFLKVVAEGDQWRHYLGGETPMRPTG